MDRVSDGEDGQIEQWGMDSGEERTQLSDSRQSTMNHNQGLNQGLTHDEQGSIRSKTYSNKRGTNQSQPGTP